MFDCTDKIFLERMRTFLDHAAAGGKKKIMMLASESENMHQMLHYFPGGLDFSVPFHTQSWRKINYFMRSPLDPFRPDDVRQKFQGRRFFNPGVVELKPAPHEELDRRVFHSWLEPIRRNASRRMMALGPVPNTGSWKRPGLLLNDTLLAKLDRTLAGCFPRGSEFHPDGKKWELTDEAVEAVKRRYVELEAIRSGTYNGEEGAVAHFYWNFQSMFMLPQGPSLPEMVGRVVRWVSGVVGMPIERAEVSRIVEPWDRPGSHGTDWLLHMENIGIKVHRVWPPQYENANLALTNRIYEDLTKSPKPKLIVILAKDVIFDHHLRFAQQAGIDIVVIGQLAEGLFYPANSTLAVPIGVLPWEIVKKEIFEAVSNPFLDGDVMPDGQLAISRYSNRLRPVLYDREWGAPSKLSLKPAPDVIKLLQAPGTRNQLLDYRKREKWELTQRAAAD